MQLQPVLADLHAESDDLDAMIAALPDDGWATPTPAAGWTIAHQIAHLAWTDEAAVLAVTDPDEFQAELTRNLAHGAAFVDDAAAAGAASAPAALLARWRDGRAALAEALLAVPPDSRVTWFGPR